MYANAHKGTIDEIPASVVCPWTTGVSFDGFRNRQPAIVLYSGDQNFNGVSGFDMLRRKLRRRKSMDFGSGWHIAIKNARGIR